MPKPIQNISDMSDEEVVKSMECKIQPMSGTYRTDPLEQKVVIATGRSLVVHNDSIFEDIKKRYMDILANKK